MASTFDAIYGSQYDLLFKSDQFYIDSKLNKILASHGFQEGNPETWAPTFKLKVSKDSKEIMIYGTKRVPSWTDRIIYHSNKVGNRDSLPRAPNGLVRYPTFGP